MRVSFLLLVLAVSATLFPASPARGLSDAERIEKLARKYAVDVTTVFTPQLRPKTLCYCTGVAVRTIGFLTYGGNPVALQCAIPTTLSPEGQLSVVDYGCNDFEILAR